MGSETGVLPVAPERVVKQWRLQPGKMFLIDLEQGRIIDDAELKAELAARHPYQKWLAQSQFKLEELPAQPAPAINTKETLLDRQQAFGYTQEDLNLFLAVHAHTREEPIRSL